LLDGQRRSSKCGQGYVFSVRRSLNTYLLGAVLVLWLRFRVRLVDVCDCDFWGGKFFDGGGANVLYSMLSDNNRVLHVGVFVTVVRTDRLMDSSDTAAQPGDDSRWW